MENKELTYGQKAVGLSFNPSNDSQVDIIKMTYANIIDLLNDIRNDDNIISTQEQKRLLSIAITEAQSAQMWAVKGVTYNY